MAFILSTSIWLASLESTEQILRTGPSATTALRIAFGPLTGLFEAVRAGEILNSLAGFVLATLCSVWPLTLWIRGGGWLWLAIATVTWIGSGYFCAVAAAI